MKKPLSLQYRLSYTDDSNTTYKMRFWSTHSKAEQTAKRTVVSAVSAKKLTLEEAMVKSCWNRLSARFISATELEIIFKKDLQ